MEERGWVIERWINSRLYYWDGHGTARENFDERNERAIRFAREQDACAVLAWCLGGDGKVAEHIWVPGPTQEHRP